MQFDERFSNKQLDEANFKAIGGAVKGAAGKVAQGAKNIGSKVANSKLGQGVKNTATKVANSRPGQAIAKGGRKVKEIGGKAAAKTKEVAGKSAQWVKDHPYKAAGIGAAGLGAAGLGAYAVKKKSKNEALVEKLLYHAGY